MGTSDWNYDGGEENYDEPFYEPGGRSALRAEDNVYEVKDLSSVYLGSH